MSTLTVHDLQGFSTYSNDVRIPSGHKLRIEGNLKLPEWTTATRPSAETGLIGWNSTLSVFEAYNGTEWVAVGDSKPDGSSADKAFDKATDVMVNLSNPATGWYWVKVNGVAKKQWLDTSYDGGGWTMVASNVYNISIPALTYAQAATSTDHYVSSGSTWGSGDPKQYAAWMGLDGWQGIANGNNANRDVVYYVASSSVPLGSTGSHSKRARWRWTGWGANYDWVGENSLNVELGSPNPGVWSYHILLLLIETKTSMVVTVQTYTIEHHGGMELVGLEASGVEMDLVIRTLLSGIVLVVIGTTMELCT